jgi:outer membrane receptor for ferrienterochelin and colicins
LHFGSPFQPGQNMSCFRYHLAVAAAAFGVLQGTAAQAQESGPAVVLPPVSVTATGTERDVRDAPASLTVIGRDQLEWRPVQDLADALRGSPGISLQGIGLGRQGISIRGMPADSTLVLIDGRRVNVAGSAIAHADFDLNWVPLEAIERIDVVRGPMSSLYGSDALGGVVNVITRAATDHWVQSYRLFGGLTEHSGAGSPYQGSAYVGGPLIPGQLGLTLTGQVQGRTDVPDSTDPRTTALEERQAVAGALGLTWTPDAAQRIDFNYSIGTEDRWRWMLSSGAVPNLYRSSDDILRQQIALTHRGDWEWGQTQLRVYRSQLDRQNGILGPGTPVGPQTLTDDVADARITIPAWGWHRFSVGGEFRRERLEDPSVTQSGSDEATQYALFAQDEITLSQGLSLVVGARFDNHQAYGWHTSPRAYLVWQATPELTLRAGVGTGFRAPTLKQLSPEYSAVGGGGRFTIVGNPDLQPETNASYEIGAAYETPEWELRGTLFQNNLNDLVQTLCVASCGVRGRERRTYINVNRARIQGVELGGGVSLPANFRLNVNYTYISARDLTNDQELAERPNHLINGTLSWSPEGPFSAQLMVNYVGRQVVAQTIGGATVNTPVSPYTMVTIEGAYRITENLTFRAGIQNLGDERLANDGGEYSYADPGRLYYMTLQAAF